MFISQTSPLNQWRGCIGFHEGGVARGKLTDSKELRRSFDGGRRRFIQRITGAILVDGDIVVLILW